LDASTDPAPVDADGDAADEVTLLDADADADTDDLFFLILFRNLLKGLLLWFISLNLYFPVLLHQVK